MNKSIIQASDKHPSADLAVLPGNDSIQVKNLALVILTTLAVIFALDWAQNFVITLLLGILLSYTLNPVVKWLEYVKIPRMVGSSIVILTLILSIGFAGFTLRGQVQSIIAQLPEVTTKLTAAFETKRGEPLTDMQKVQIAASQVETATNSVTNAVATKKNSTMHVVIDDHKFKIGDFLWRGSLGVFGFVGEAITMAFLAYFLLLSGDTFKRKLVHLTGPSLSRKKITVHILEDINNSIQRYMFMLLITNVMVGLSMWLLFRMIGLENAGAWAVFAGFLHVVPYFGPVVTAGATGIASYMQFGSTSMAVLVAGATMLVATIVGVFLTTWMTGRIAKMNSAAVFISLLFFTWLWGVWGMLLGIPLIVIIKVICVHIEHLQPVAELLSE
ncbi:AI-2E family transporter [Methylotenera sp.]|uniref:AI-2E family transporter n=1 Tax=Methylotenera sp. TaxID=2051956 RepID=UPI00248A8673|nr:AI-2E family transporter [Methylotenera sp.]MDI1363252.1 AI-2E family transporter [Methylotenera sp.]